MAVPNFYAQYQAAREKAKAVRGVQSGVALADHSAADRGSKTALQGPADDHRFYPSGDFEQSHAARLHRANLKTKLNASFQTYKEEARHHLPPIEAVGLE